MNRATLISNGLPSFPSRQIVLAMQRLFQLNLHLSYPIFEVSRIPQCHRPFPQTWDYLSASSIVGKRNKLVEYIPYSSKPLPGRLALAVK